MYTQTFYIYNISNRRCNNGYQAKYNRRRRNVCESNVRVDKSKTDPIAEQEKREKLKFELAKLTKQNETGPQYDISDVFQTALSAIPQRAPSDEFARFSSGSRVLFGKTEDYMHVVISEKWRDWEKSGNKQGDPAISRGDI